MITLIDVIEHGSHGNEEELVASRHLNDLLDEALAESFPASDPVAIRVLGGPTVNTMTYRVVKHDGGWAYEVNGTYSEPFPTRDDARTAAQRAAAEQATPGETTEICYEDEQGKWHTEVDSGTDRPKATVQG